MGREGARQEKIKMVDNVKRSSDKEGEGGMKKLGSHVLMVKGMVAMGII